MSSLDNEIVRRGYFNILWNPRDGVLRALSSVSSKRQWVVLRKQSRGNPTVIEIYKSEDQTIAPLRIVHLDKNNFKEIQTDDKKKTFSLNLNDEVCLFQCSSRADMEDWYRDIMTYGSPRNSNGLRDEPPMIHRTLSHVQSNGIDDFDGVPDQETFPVTLRKSNTMTFNGPCLLEIMKDFDNNKFHIALFTKEEVPRLVVKWQIDHIRQYGSHKSAFKFESGRKSSTGVDWFILDTEYEAAERIHRSVDYWAKHIVEQVSNRGEFSRPGRANTAVPISPSSPPSIPTKGTPAKITPGSLPRQQPHQMPPAAHTAPSSRQPVYTSLSGTNRDAGSVYELPDRSGVDKNKAPASPAPTAPSGGHYQPLQPTASPWNTGDTYEALNQGTRSTANGRGNHTPKQQRPRDPTYTSLTPQTRQSHDTYMPLDKARS